MPLKVSIATAKQMKLIIHQEDRFFNAVGMVVIRISSLRGLVQHTDYVLLRMKESSPLKQSILFRAKCSHIKGKYKG